MPGSQCRGTSTHREGALRLNLNQEFPTRLGDGFEARRRPRKFKYIFRYIASPDQYVDGRWPAGPVSFRSGRGVARVGRASRAHHGAPRARDQRGFIPPRRMTLTHLERVTRDRGGVGRGTESLILRVRNMSCVQFSRSSATSSS